MIFGTLSADQGVELKGSTQNLNDSIAHVVKAWSGLTEGLGTWSSAKGNFVDTFSRLISKSATQVGTNTSRTYADLHTFITAFSTSEGELLLQIERTVSLSPAGQAEEQYLEEEKLGAEGTQIDNKEGEAGLLGEERNERGGFRGNRRGGERGNRGNFRGGYFRKHNQDDEGFVVVKDDEGSAHQNHYPSRRQRGGARGSSEETEAESSVEANTVEANTVEANSVENVALASSVVVNIANSVENAALANTAEVNTVEVNSVENAVEVSSVETEVALPMEIDPGLSTSPASTEVAVT